MAGFEPGRVAATRRLAAEIVNVTITAESLLGFTFQPGAEVLIRFPGGDENADERRYSVWQSSAGAGTFDLCIVQHGLGPGSRWAAACAPGDPVEIARSRALPIALDPAADVHIMVGDETSVAAAEALIVAMPAHAVVVAYFEIESRQRCWPAAELARPDAIRWVERCGRPGAALLARLDGEQLTSPERTTAYVTGEAWLCAVLHAHLVRKHGFDAAAIRAMPYWKARAT